MNNALDLAQAYATYRPLLFGALGRLASHGYALPPDEGLGLVHDFFLEAWPGLQHRYDPERGRFSTYVFASFVHFARPRIVRMQRWQQQLGDPDQSSAAVQESSSDTILDIARVRDALGKLPLGDRELLMTRFGSETSERALAKRMSASRYHTRERLVEALARFITVLDDRLLLSASDRPLARLLWVDQRSLPDAAARLNLTLPQAKGHKSRILNTLHRALRAGDIGLSRERSSMQSTVCDLWRNFVTHPEDVVIRANVVAARQELADHIDECDACGECMPKDPERLALLYGALAGNWGREREEPDDLLCLRDAIDVDVRNAVEQVLYPALPPSVVQRVADIDALVVFRAVDSLALLLDRHWRHQTDAHPLLLLTKDGLFRKVPQTDSLIELEPRRALLREVRIMSKADEAVADRLLNWTMLSARSHPRLLPGVTTVLSQDDRLEVRAVHRPLQLDLGQLWSPQAVLLARQLAVSEHIHTAATVMRVRQGQT